MPVVVQVILGAAAVATAVGVLWRKVVLPAFRLASAADELVPLLRDFTEAFKGTPQVFAILNEVAAQFRTDSGSSLRDVINRLEDVAAQQTLAGEAARQLAAGDRQTLAHLMIMLGDLDTKAKELTADRAKVAEQLARAEAKVEGVAADLAASHDRADAAEGDNAGAAADAASRSGEQDG